jgi:SAM-dependent methyltransferase
MALRERFGEDAELYDRMRPGYPGALFDDLAELTLRARLPDVGSGTRARVLEIGPGTGQATVALLEHGYAVSAVELSPTMAAILRHRFGSRVAVSVGPFEDFVADDPFDVVFSATAFHWVDPAVRLERAAEALRPGGALATVRTEHISGGTAEFFELVQRCYEQWDPATPPDLHLQPAAAIAADPLEGPGAALFFPPAYRRYEWEQSYTSVEYRNLLLTYSGHRALPAESQRGLLECITTLADTRFGGRIIKRYMNELRVATRL